jgi:predicted DNA-binding transcriptional regulator YafY
MMPRKKKNTDAVALGKAARLEKEQHLLFRNPRGLTARELAKVCGVTPRQIQKDIEVLHDSGVPVYDVSDDKGIPRYAIVAGYFLPPIHFNLNEATALYVAARLLARYSDENNPLVIQALAKLAGAMPEAIAAHVHNTIRSLAYKPKNPTFASVFETITRGWAEHKKVRIWHQASDSENVHDYTLSPYFIEPASAGYSTYVIGYSTFFDDIHTFKIERIRQAQLLDEPFELPEGFDGTELLKDAWGVMYGKEIVEVRLRFVSSATRRIKESIWHPSQKIEDCDDGGCVMSVKINHTLEMENWIRGWGSQVTVLAPAELRAKVAEEARKMAKVYEQA